MKRIKLTLLLALAWWSAAPASAAWYQARSRHFLVYSEGTPVAAEKVAADLERFDQAVRKLIQLPDVEGEDPNPVTVFVVDGVSAVETLCKGSNGKSAKDCRYIAGFYDSRVSGSVAFVPRRAGAGPFDTSAQTILFHEYAHHLMMASSGSAYPAWYREGFAEFVSNVELTKDGEVRLGVPAYDRVRSLYLLPAIPMRRLLTVGLSSLSPTEREAFYARAWLAMHYLAFSSERRGQVNTYLKAINKGTPAAEAAATAFGDLHELDKEVSGYLRRGRLTYLRQPVPAIPDGAIKVVQLGAGEATMMAVRIQSNRGVNEDTAKEVVAQARMIASSYPDDPRAQDALVEAEFDAANLDAADVAADRVLAKAPDDMRAMIYKALIILRRAHDDPLSGDAMFKDARKWLQKANRIQPDAAWPLFLFFTTYQMQGQKPTPNAVAALERAFALAPQDNGVRMTLVQHYLTEKNFSQARAVLAPLAFDPHISADHPAVKLLAQIDEWERTGTSNAAK